MGSIKFEKCEKKSLKNIMWFGLYRVISGCTRVMIGLNVIVYIFVGFLVLSCDNSSEERWEMVW